ncbi:Odorant receptor Or15 [Rhyzopertha dominica]|nr:Odorant receptor Or15 [Rhyzopertha dominica]
MEEELASDYFRMHLKVLKWLGIPVRPLRHRTFVNVVYCIYAVVFVTIMAIMLIVTEAIDLFLHLDDMDRLSFGLCYLVTHILGFVKVIMFLIKRKKICELLDALEDGLMLPNMERGGQQEFVFIKNAIQQANLQAYIFNGLAFSIIGNRAIYAMTTTPKIFNFTNEFNETYFEKEVITPFTTWMPFPLNRSPNYEFVVFYQLLTTYLYAFYIGATDTVMTGMIIHIKAQWLILKYNFKRFADIDVKKDNKGIKIKSGAYEKVELIPESLLSGVIEKCRDCIRHHHVIMQYCKDLETHLSLIILMQFLCSLLLICFTLFQLSVTTPKSFRFLSISLYLVLMCSQLFFYCYNGNEVILHSETLKDAIFNSDWIVTSEKAKKMLIITMIAAQKPAVFTAGGFSVLSLVSYMAIIKGSASYFMFLRKMGE